jgi:hypothetical protein
MKHASRSGAPLSTATIDSSIRPVGNLTIFKGSTSLTSNEAQDQRIVTSLRLGY